MDTAEQRQADIGREVETLSEERVRILERRLDEAQQGQRVRIQRIHRTRGDRDARNIHHAIVGIILLRDRVGHGRWHDQALDPGTPEIGREGEVPLWLEHRTQRIPRRLFGLEVRVA